MIGLNKYLTWLNFATNGVPYSKSFFRANSYFIDSLHVLFNCEEPNVESTKEIFFTRPNFWFEKKISLNLSFLCHSHTMSCPLCPVFLKVSLVSCLCLYLPVIDRSLRNPERKKKCLIYTKLMLALYLHFLCDYVKLSLSYKHTWATEFLYWWLS